MIKIGVIGAGSMGKNHVRVCSELDMIELIGVADRDKNQVKTVGERFDTQIFDDYKHMISDIDAAIIATPTNTHHAIASDLLKNGKHVLVEKPICDTITKAEELVRLAEKTHTVLAVGHIERHNPVVKFVKEGLQKNQFGEIIALTAKRVSNFPGRIKDVGVIFDFGVHDIDVMRYLAGEIDTVYAHAGIFTKDIAHEDHATIMLTFENGICGTIEVNWLTPMKIRKILLTCSKSLVEADYIEQSATISSSSFNKINDMNLYQVPIQYNIDHVSLEKREPLRNEIIDFVHAIDKNSAPLVSGNDGIIALKIAEAATQSYKKRKEVKISYDT